MTFSADVKKEITSMPAATGTLMALVRMNGSLGLGQHLSLSITTEKSAIAQYIYKAFLELFEVKAELQVHQKSNLSKNRVYTVFIEEDVASLLDELSLADSLMLDSGVPEVIQSDPILQLDYLRGVFLSAGTVTNSDKSSYQLTLRSVYWEHAQGLADLLAEYGLSAKVYEQRSHWLTYLTKAGEIADFLTLIGAMHSRLVFEDSKIVHEMRGLANRQSNFQTANINKTVGASQEVIKALQALAQVNELPPNMLSLAQLRIDHPEASLDELGKLHDPPLSKSAVNHRFRKILELSREIGTHTKS
ncbi:MAG: DNA-binding protein WhiA [Streptococcaceae bacterium]|jgi:DNA-binding protein WhiA|nr:DNA-binding protein WhiA [Streptococcaceae bacterium]